MVCRITQLVAKPCGAPRSRAPAAAPARRPKKTSPRRRAPAAAGARPRRPDSRSGWRTVVRPMAAASSMSSKPMTDRSPGTASPARAAASSTPKACTSEAAKMADGRRRSASSSRVSSSGALAAERAAPDVARRQRDAGLAQRLRACPPGAAGWRRRRTGCPRRRRRRRCRRWPASSRWRAARAPPATSSMATLGSSACATSMSTVGTRSRCSARTSVGLQRQRDDDDPVDAVAAGEAPQRGAALLERLDVEERQVVGAAPDDVVDAAQALDHGRAGEERGDDAERLGAPERQVARGRAGAVAELVHDGADAHAGGLRPRRASR